jgi:hypothetical protein
MGQKKLADGAGANFEGLKLSMNFFLHEGLQK